MSPITVADIPKPGVERTYGLRGRIRWEHRARPGAIDRVDGSTQPRSILQLDFLNAGNFEAGSVVGLLIMTLTISCALLARYVGLRAGIGATK